MEKQLIITDPEILSGIPCFAGTRVPVKTVFDYIEGNEPLDEFLEDFPTVSKAMVLEVLEAAKQKMLAPTQAGCH